VLLERFGEGELVSAGGRQLELRRFLPNRKHADECIETYLSRTYQPVRVAPLTW
jgi:hypothetical protein